MIPPSTFGVLTSILFKWLLLVLLKLSIIKSLYILESLVSIGDLKLLFGPFYFLTFNLEYIFSSLSYFGTYRPFETFNYSLFNELRISLDVILWVLLLLSLPALFLNSLASFKDESLSSCKRGRSVCIPKTLLLSNALTLF